jgi:peptidoglycan hydrolase CwlO-like protein
MNKKFNKKFILGMVAASFVANTTEAQSLSQINLSQINEKLKSDFPESTSRTALKDVGVFTAEALAIVGITYFFPRIDKKALNAKNAELQKLRQALTSEDIVNKVHDIDTNLQNYEAVTNDGSPVSATEKLGPINETVQKELDALAKERSTISADMDEQTKKIIAANQEIARIQAEIDSIKDKVSNYETKSGKLKSQLEMEVNNRINQIKYHTSQIDISNNNIESGSKRIEQIDSMISEKLADIKNRTRFTLKPEVALERAMLLEQNALTREQKAVRIANLEKDIRIIAQKGLIRGSGMRVIRAAMVASGVVLVLDAGVRGYIVLGLDRDAGWLPALNIAAESCSDEKSCVDILNKIESAKDFIGNNLNALIQAAKGKIN